MRRCARRLWRRRPRRSDWGRRWRRCRCRRSRWGFPRITSSHPPRRDALLFVSFPSLVSPLKKGHGSTCAFDENNCHAHPLSPSNFSFVRSQPDFYGFTRLSFAISRCSVGSETRPSCRSEYSHCRNKILQQPLLELRNPSL